MAWMLRSFLSASGAGYYSAGTGRASPPRGGGPGLRRREEGPEHPRHLLVALQQPGQEVARADVMVPIDRDGEVVAELADDRLVVGEQVRHHARRVGDRARLLLEPRVMRELGKRAPGPAAQRPRPLGDVVDDAVQLLVLRLEERVQVVELRAGHVPVVVPRLGVEQVLV